MQKPKCVITEVSGERFRFFGRFKTEKKKSLNIMLTFTMYDCVLQCAGSNTILLQALNYAFTGKVCL